MNREIETNLFSALHWAASALDKERDGNDLLLVLGWASASMNTALQLAQEEYDNKKQIAI